jgi:4-oxalomesaconate hydratase
LFFELPRPYETIRRKTMSVKKLLVVGAHSADFVWRAAGTIAVTTAQGGKATVVALSYGEHGESGELWKEPGQTIENVKRIITDTALTQIVELLREESPDVILTHTPVDPFNPDHPVAYQAVQKARLLASGAGVASAFKRINPPDWYLFEPHQPELCEFVPNTFVDITPVMDQKIKAMAAMKAQSYLKDYYTELAARRGNHARRISGKQDVRFAEALQRMLPWVVESL